MIKAYDETGADDVDLANIDSMEQGEEEHAEEDQLVE